MLKGYKREDSVEPDFYGHAYTEGHAGLADLCDALNDMYETLLGERWVYVRALPGDEVEILNSDTEDNYVTHFIIESGTFVYIEGDAGHFDLKTINMISDPDEPTQTGFSKEFEEFRSKYWMDSGDTPSE